MATHEVLNQLSGYREDKKPELPLPIVGGIPGNLKIWPIVSKLQPDFIETIRLVCVFGREGTEALFVTLSDEVWALGTNENGCLGTGNASPCASPVKVAALCGKAIQTFAYGVDHVLALTETGKVYGWGGNSYSQVGKATPRKILTPRLVHTGKDPVLEIACGDDHSACRTGTGHVYCWGCNVNGQIGIGHTKNQPTPRRVEGLIANLACTGISCTSSSTIAIFENGEVYVWGWNCSGQLGINSRKDQLLPVKLNFKTLAIKKVTCGGSHTLALADDGSLYVWGRNNEGQLGLNHREDQWIPARHPLSEGTYGSIVEIAASRCSSAVATDKSKFLMWGANKEGLVMVPTDVPCESMQDVFASLTRNNVTPVPLLATPVALLATPTAPSFSLMDSTVQDSSLIGWRGNWLNTTAEQFDNPTFSDVKFLVGSETIHAHRSVLNFQSEYFRKMFQGPWKNSGDTIEVSTFSFPVYRAFVRYFYTGEVNFQDVDAFEFLDLANSYSENVLKSLCQRRLENMITIDNCARVYSVAVKCGAKDLENVSSRFAAEHLTAVTQTTAFAALPQNVISRLLSDVAKFGAFKN